MLLAVVKLKELPQCSFWLSLNPALAVPPSTIYSD
jgi:hypothetical protein